MRIRLLGLGAVVCLWGWAGIGLGFGQGTGVRKPIETVRGVRTLGSEEAGEARPVKLHAVVMIYDPSIQSLFVQDRTGGIYVHMGDLPVLPLREGTAVDLDGVTAPGDYAPIVLLPKLKILGDSKGRLVPIRISTEMLKTGVYDSQWVEMEGVVHSVIELKDRAIVRLKTGDGFVEAVSVGHCAAEYEDFVGAKIRIRGVAAAYYNKRHQLTGVHLFLGNSTDIKVVRSAGGDGFDLPVRRISLLARFDPKADLMQRVHIRGRATLVWPGAVICIQDEMAGICTQYSAKEKFAVGMLVDAVGFPTYAEEQPGVEDVVLRRVAVGVEDPTVLTMNPQSAMKGEGAGTLVSMEGEFVGMKANRGVQEFFFRSNGVVFSAVAPPVSQQAVAPSLAVGSRVRVTGVEIAETDRSERSNWTSEQRVTSLRLLTRSWEDVQVLQRASWWSTSHMLYVVCCATALILVVLVWAALLRAQVNERTKELQVSEERFRHLAHHDVLTGAPNRAFFYETAAKLQAQAEAARSRFAVMLLDMDRFKPINDTLGHEAGDKVLRAVVDRAGVGLGSNDMFARLGGDEFAVLVEFSNAESVMKKARRMLHNICGPLALEQGVVEISASVGVAFYPEDGATMGELLRRADEAMYRSKQKGRGRVERFGQIETSEEADGAFVNGMAEAHLV